MGEKPLVIFDSTEREQTLDRVRPTAILTLNVKLRVALGLVNVDFVVMEGCPIIWEGGTQGTARIKGLLQRLIVFMEWSKCERVLERDFSGLDVFEQMTA
jgi:hypothetical protein